MLHPLAPVRKPPAVNPPRVRKVAGSEPLRSAAAHTPNAPAVTAPSVAVTAPPHAVVAEVPAAADALTADPADDPQRASPDRSSSVQDRLASWACNLSLLQELTERLVRTA